MLRWIAVMVCGLAIAASAALASTAQAAGEMEITSFEAGLTDYQAGGHPDAFVSFRLATQPASDPGPRCLSLRGDPIVCETVKGGAPKDIVVELPKGLFGNPKAIPQCTLAELNVDTCPVASQIGVQWLQLISFGGPNGGLVPPEGVKTPIYNMVPERGEVAKFGFRVLGTVNSFISARVRSDGDYGLTTTVGNIFTGLPVWGTDLRFWGDPYNTVHDPDRYCKGDVNRPAAFGCAAFQEPTPFMVAPHECGATGLATLRVRSWLRPGDGDWTSAQSVPQTVHGCDKLDFKPSFSLQPTTSTPDSPMGLDVALDFAQQFNVPGGLEAPPLKDVVVTLPEGVSVNAASADGLQACPDGALRLNSTAAVECPFASKIGSVEAVTPVLNETLTGGIYLRPQNSDNPESGELFRIAITLENEDRGLSIRLPGAIRANSQTGRIEASFLGNPQLPVSSIDLHFKSGPRAPLATPATCGPKTTTATLSSWGGQVETLTDTFTIDCVPGLGGFSPFANAGTQNAAAGASSTFTLRFGRNDGQQSLKDLTVDLPEGLLARLADVQALCTDARASAGTCGEESRIGSVISGAGAGTNPLYLPGRVYMTGPYKGAPLGMSIVVPAIAGPFNLGDVVVRTAVHVDRQDASLTVISDPLPSILKGVPLRIRTVEVNVDKPRFMLNPTSCDPKQVDTAVGSVSGALAKLRSRFQVGSCARLPFTPSMKLTVGARGRTRSGITTPFEALLTQPAGQAANRIVDVTLPLAINARLPIVNRACTLEQFANYQRGECDRARIGEGTAYTPLLKDPLHGPAFFVRNPARRLPDLMVALRGQIAIDLTGKVSIPRDFTLRTRFDTVPDAPISRFSLRLVAGRQGPLGVVENLCGRVARRQRARVGFISHSGKTRNLRPKLTIKGCSSRAAARARGRGRGGRRGSGRRASARARARKK